MASFGSGFATGFLNQLSSGMENKRKYEMETQRDLDKIAMNNIFETARDFQKTYPKSVGEVRKKHERFVTAMQLTNNNQAAAEAIASDPDLKLNDYDKIREMAIAYKGQEGYVSSIPKDTQAQLDALNARVQSTFTQAQKYMDRSKAFKRSGMESPFQQPELDKTPLTEAGVRPAMMIPPKDKDDEYKKFIISHADRFANPAAAMGAFNSLRDKEGLPPIPMDQASRVFAGVTFGKNNKNYEDDPKFQAMLEQVRNTNPGMSPDDVKKIAVNSYTRMDRNFMQVGDERYNKLQAQIAMHVASLGKVDFVVDPATGQPHFAFGAKMNGMEAQVAKAMEEAQDGFRNDIMMGKEPRPFTYYANGAARRNGFLSDPKTTEQPPVQPAPTPVDRTQQESRAGRAGVNATPQTQHPAPQMAPPTNPAPTPGQPINYDANGKRIP